MPRHSCPGHPDCFIDCPGGGSAVFHERLGPCERTCEDTDFGQSILELSSADIVVMRFSGAMTDYPLERLTRFARSLDARNLDIGQNELRDLLFLIAQNANGRIDASWEDADLVDLLAILGAAAGMGELAGMP